MMGKDVGRARWKFGLMAYLWKHARLIWELFKDGRVPIWLKVGIPALVVLYILFPIDLSPDLFPLLGQLDDLTILLLAMKLFVDLCPPEVVEEHLRRLSSIPGTYRVLEEYEEGEHHILE